MAYSEFVGNLLSVMPNRISEVISNGGGSMIINKIQC